MSIFESIASIFSKKGDVWELKNGKLVYKKKTRGNDIIHYENADSEDCIELEGKKVIRETQKKDGYLEYFEVKDLDFSRELFEWLATRSKNREWTMLNNITTRKNYLGTNQKGEKTSSVYSGSLSKHIRNGDVLEFTHSHAFWFINSQIQNNDRYILGKIPSGFIWVSINPATNEEVPIANMTNFGKIHTPINAQGNRERVGDAYYAYQSRLKFKRSSMKFRMFDSTDGTYVEYNESEIFQAESHIERTKNKNYVS
ncbi:MAG: hypothetical protein H6604_08205 [Flavobacteriales bacterium]|nr:hypothetical protein [Flavobacteriales bacterium]